jgi:hypothetical protein
MRYFILAMAILLFPAYAIPAQAQSQFSISVGNRGTSLGFTMSTYPTLARIPGYPVYYDPRVNRNYFFYDGLYWVYQDDNWYSSPWYNGPWDWVDPSYVPLFVLRIPVRYYRRPPSYFRVWRSDAAPRWGEHWGPKWERQHSGWDRWDRRSVPRAAPLPTYQRQYTGNRYPRDLREQRTIESRSYRYQPREAKSRHILQQRRYEPESRNRRQQPARQQQNDRDKQEQPARQLRNARDKQEQPARQQRNTRGKQEQHARQQRNTRSKQEQHARQQRNTRSSQQQKESRKPQKRQQPGKKAQGIGKKTSKDRSSQNKQHPNDGDKGRAWDQ